MEDGEWSIVESRKRKALEPSIKRPRGRPRFTAQRALDQPSLDPFLGPKGTQELQEAQNTLEELSTATIENLQDSEPQIEAISTTQDK